MNLVSSVEKGGMKKGHFEKWRQGRRENSWASEKGVYERVLRVEG